MVRSARHGMRRLEEITGGSRICMSRYHQPGPVQCILCGGGSRVHLLQIRRALGGLVENARRNKYASAHRDIVLRKAGEAMSA